MHWQLSPRLPSTDGFCTASKHSNYYSHLFANTICPTPALLKDRKQQCMALQGRRKHISIGPAPVRAMLALCKEALAMVVLCNEALAKGVWGASPRKNLGFLRTFPNVISEDMRVILQKISD